MFTVLAACSPSAETPSSGEVAEDSSASTGAVGRSCRGRAEALRADVDGDGRLDTVWRGQSAISSVVVGLCTAAGATAEVEVGGMGEGDFETIDIEQDGRAEIFQGTTTVSQHVSEVLRYLDGDLFVVDGFFLVDGLSRLETPESEVVEAWGCEDADADGVRDLVTVAVSRTHDAAIERRRGYRLQGRSAVAVSSTERVRAAFPTLDERLTMAC